MRDEITCYALDLSSGPFVFDKRMPGNLVVAIERAEHGDWKTQLVREKFMGMHQDEVGELVDVFDNCYGRWCRVRLEDGHTADVEPKSLALLPSKN